MPEATEIKIFIDEVGLSFRGWEIIEIRARLSPDPDDRLSFPPTLTVIGRAIFRGAEPGLLTPGEMFPPPLVLKASIPSLSQVTAHLQIAYETMHSAARGVRIRWQGKLLPAGIHLNDINLHLELTAFDSVDTDLWTAFIPTEYREIPIDIDASISTGDSHLVIQNARAFIPENRHSDRLFLQTEGVYVIGSTESLEELYRHSDPDLELYAFEGETIPMTPFEIRSGYLNADFLDPTGFPVFSTKLVVDVWIHVDENGQTLPIARKWYAEAITRLSDIAGDVSRITLELDPYYA